MRTHQYGKFEYTRFFVWDDVKKELIPQKIPVDAVSEEAKVSAKVGHPLVNESGLEIKCHYFKSKKQIIGEGGYPVCSYDGECRNKFSVGFNSICVEHNDREIKKNKT